MIIWHYERCSSSSSPFSFFSSYSTCRSNSKVIYGSVYPNRNSSINDITISNERGKRESNNPGCVTDCVSFELEKFKCILNPKSTFTSNLAPDNNRHHYY